MKVWRPLPLVVIVLLGVLIGLSMYVDYAYNPPSDSVIKEHFLKYRPEFMRLRDMLQQDPSIRTISKGLINHEKPDFDKSGIDKERYDEYLELMTKTGVTYLRYFRPSEPRPGAVFVMWNNGPWRLLNGTMATKGMRYFEPQVPKPSTTEVVPDGASGSGHSYVSQTSEVENLWYVQFEQQDLRTAKEY